MRLYMPSYALKQEGGLFVNAYEEENLASNLWRRFLQALKTSTNSTVFGHSHLKLEPALKTSTNLTVFRHSRLRLEPALNTSTLAVFGHSRPMLESRLERKKKP